jgi:hypothetical protein
VGAGSAVALAADRLVRLVVFLAGVDSALDFFAVVFFAEVFFASDLLAEVLFVGAFFVVLSAMALLSQLLADHESFDQRILTGGRLVLAQLAGGASSVDRFELSADRDGVVELLLGLTPDLLGDRHDAAHRRERRGEHCGQQTHQPVPTKS